MRRDARHAEHVAFVRTCEAHGLESTHGTAKTRIAFLARVRFAGITALSESGMTCSFSLPTRVRSRRFVKVEEVVPGWWVHRLRVTDVGQLDAEVQAWLRESYHLMGMQEGLKMRHPVR
jgi:Domain of unknown function (DUF5655)